MDALRAATVGVHALGSYLRADHDHYPPSLVVGYATPSAHVYQPALDALIQAINGFRRS